MTIGSPAGAPSVIAVGASANDRVFCRGWSVTGGAAVPRCARGSASGQAGRSPGSSWTFRAWMATGWRVIPCRAAALSGAIALISRGTCNFEVKLNYAQAAGAVAALVYNNVDGAPVTMGAPATLPAQMVISMADGDRAAGAGGGSALR